MKSTSKGRSKSTSRTSKKALSLYARSERPVSSVEVAAQTLSPFAHAANVFFFTYSPRTRALLSWSTNASEVLGVKDADIIREGNLFLRHVHPRDRFLILSNLESSLEGKHSYEATYRWIRPDTRELRWLHCRANLSPVDDEKVFEGMIIDLSAIYENSSKLLGNTNADMLLAALKQILLLFDSEGRLLYYNASHLEGFTFGDPDFRINDLRVGRTLEGLFQDHTLLEKHIKSITTAIEFGIVTQTIVCAEKTFEVTYESIVDEHDSPQVVVKASDVSHQLQLAAEVKKLSKTASYQIITSGVVHNINNALQAIIGEASSLDRGQHDIQRVRATADRIMKLAHRTADLTHELLDLNSDLITQIDPNICVISALNKSQEHLPGGMLLDVSFGSIELCLGRQRAFTECLGEIIKLLWHSVKATHTSLRTLSVNKSCQIEISLKDNSLPLLPELVEQRLISLSNSQGIPLSIQRHDNTLTCTLSIPITIEPKSEQSIILGKSSPRVIVVDDDPLVGETIQGLLQQDSISSLVFQQPQAALTYLTSHPDIIDLVIVDALMPIMNGEAFIREVRKIAPNIPILGFTGAPRMLENLLNAGANDVVLKPLDPLALKRLVLKYLHLANDDLPLVGNS